MTRPIAATLIIVGGILLALVMGVTLNLRFGFPIFSMFMLLAAPFCLAFGVWLRGHGFQDYAKYAMTASVTLVIGVAIPLTAPGAIAYIKSVGARIERAASRSALERSAPQPVTPGLVLIGASGETLYWWHPCDSKPVLYDRGGEHPQGCGPLQPVTPAVARLMEHLRQQPAAQPQPVATPLPEEQVRELVRTELAKVQPPAEPAPVAMVRTEPAPEPPTQGTWLEVPPAKPN